jgi:hypothetical protein
MEPLDAQEREFARILGALPGGEPPAALDAAILRAATNAARRRSGRPRACSLPPAAMWGIGSAAAAVLALGVAWQLRYGDERAPAAASAPAAQMVNERADDEAVQVELGTQAADAPFVPPPPPPASPGAVGEARGRTGPATPPTPGAGSARCGADGRAGRARALCRRTSSTSHVAREAARGCRRRPRRSRDGKQGTQAKRPTAKIAAKRASAPPPPPPPVAATAAAPAPTSIEAQSRSDAASNAALDRAEGSAVGGLADRDSAKERASRRPGWPISASCATRAGWTKPGPRSLNSARSTPSGFIPTDLAPLLSE